MNLSVSGCFLNNSTRFILHCLFNFCIQNFEIDEESFEYLSYNPMSSKKQPSLVEEHFEPVMEDADQSLSDSDLSAASESSEGELGDDKSKTWKKARAPR